MSETTQSTTPVSLYPTTEGVQFCGSKDFTAQQKLGETLQVKKSDYGPNEAFHLGAYAYTPGDIMMVSCDGIWSSAVGFAPRGFHKLAAVVYLYVAFYPVGVYTLKCFARNYAGDIIGSDVIIVDIAP